MQELRSFYINGQWVAPHQSYDFDVINPSNETVCAVISLGDEDDTNAAVSAAKEAFTTWSVTPKETRVELLEKLLSIYQERADEMAVAISTEMGAPIALAKTAQCGVGSYHIKNITRALKGLEFEGPLGKHAPDNIIVREAIGVCGLITPWNWPMNQVALKVVAALAAGCTMVLKPSEISPLSSMLFAEMIDQAGFPAGVFNLVNGDGMGVGSQLTRHRDVDMVSFTGSTRAGVAISKSAADTVKRVSLELGGKGANIVFADADESAVKRGARQCFLNSGQSCNAPTRMLVERSIYDQAVATAVQVAESTSVNLSEIEGRHIGPVVSEVQFDKIQALIAQGVGEGAELVAGGLGRPEGLEKGYFVKPTVFAGVNNNMAIAQEEIFGPVLSIIPFDTEDEAVSIANDSLYGLTNYIQTQDSVKAGRVARLLRSGMVEVNGKPMGAGAPFGGYKQSGNGREGGLWGIEEFLEVKVITGC